MRLTVNGVERELASPPLTTLLQALREELGVTSPKAGCQQGGCGTCTVLVDGRPRRACLTPIAMIEGAEVTTVEGLGTPTELAPVQAAFDEHYAAQCGFCTSGFLMASHALIEDGGGTTREEVVEALSGHVCRCTGYVKIVDAVTAAARGDVGSRERRGRHGTAGRGRRHDDPREPGMKAVGARLPRYDGVAHVTARTLYVDDVRVPGTLWTKALRSPHDHAVITHLDAAKAEALPGVHAIVTAADVPKNVYGHLEALGVPADEPLLAEGVVRYKGQPIAAVAAESEAIATAAVEAIDVRFEERPAFFDLRKALDPDTPEIHHWGPVYPHFGPHNHRRVRKGDLDAAFDAADTIVEGVYRPQAIEHCPMETQVSLSVPGGQRPADDLLLHPGDVLLHGGRGRAPGVAAEPAQARRRHGRRRLRRQGRHGHGDDHRDAGDQVPAAGEVALHARGGVPGLLDAGAVAHRDPGRRQQGRLDPRAPHAHAPRLRGLRALLALRAHEARVPSHGRLHDPGRPLRRVRRVHEPGARPPPCAGSG